ncbi:MAG TPA: DUF499 domain-containing protein, partial [Candidatus Ozemobacteraceae bacterium]|nr:DUF499 domain-containing protein [Candidatus Ozemobacteraceae bacterium]
MNLEPWYKVTVPRKEVREGRSFNPDEFAIHLEQVVTGKAPEDYRDPTAFFSRTCFTRALRDHTGMILRRLAGSTVNTAPVVTLITQFGGGKTHTLATLFHLASLGAKANELTGVRDMLAYASLGSVPSAKTAVFVGNAWDPRDGHETPWIDIARQLAGDKGVQELGKSALQKPPGTEALSRVFAAAGGPVLVLFDEVLNFLNRHRDMAESFHAFIQNLTVAMTGTTHGAAVISLPRSQVEMTEYDLEWQEKITKVVRRVSKDLIANDEAEISEVICRRLFEDRGNDKQRSATARAYADWVFERRAQLPSEWTTVDSGTTEAKAREYLKQRFEACYPFHPSTLSVFQRKWQALSQFQQTRGTLAMLAQWVSWAYRTDFQEARKEPLITLGSAPLDNPDFRGVVLGQLGESRLIAALDADISGRQSHARVLDADTKGPLKGIHRRVGSAIFFESSGGQTNKLARIPDLRVALGEPGLDTTTIDNAAAALEDKSYFLRRSGSDAFMISHHATLKKVVNDKKASLDEEQEILPAAREFVKRAFEENPQAPLLFFPTDGTAIPDSPRLTLVVADPVSEWTGTGSFRKSISEWTRNRGKAPRLYPGALVWCLRKPGKDLRDKVESHLAWQKVADDIYRGMKKKEFSAEDQEEARMRREMARDAAEDEVWASYRYVALLDTKEPDGLKIIDLGAGHSSSHETLGGRIISALKSQALLNESVGTGYLDRSWPPALKSEGIWP